MTNSHKHAASFRDPSGFLFQRKGTLYRQVNEVYRQDYDCLIESGLYPSLMDDHLLLRHEEVNVPPAEEASVYKIIQPERLRYVSYPYEWCFGQLKDAALTTLEIQKRAMQFDMSLKDCSAYNIQFHDGRPVFIDTLSFEQYREGEPWTAYRQFCQHFLAPLALMALRDIRLSQLLRVYIDGIPLDLASNLLPGRTKLNFGLLSHIHLHAASQKHYADKTVDKKAVTRRMSRISFLGLIDSLERLVKKLEWGPVKTEWGDYYDSTHNYTATALEHKRRIVQDFIARIQPENVWDLGANVGYFSRLASDAQITTLAFDIDPLAVELNYRSVKTNGERYLLPLLLDLTNPSPDLGWNNEEREAFIKRGPTDAIFALALIHHMAIANNVPLPMLAEFFQELGSWLVLEFVPKSDSQVQRLLATREDIFPEYAKESLEKIFGKYFKIIESVKVEDSERTMYLMQRKTGS